MNQLKNAVALQQVNIHSKIRVATTFLSIDKKLKRWNSSVNKVYVLSFILLSCFTLSSCQKEDEVSPQPVPVEVEAKISGTIKAAPGQTVAGTYVMACYDNSCQDEKTKFVQIEQEQTSASFEIKDLATGKYSLNAWKDNNANMKLDAGDGVGVLSSDGKQPNLIAPPKEGIELEMIIVPGSDGTVVGEGSIVGTVTAPLGHDVAGTIIIACQWNGTQCVESTSQAIEVMVNGSYIFSDLAAQPYFIIAWKDMNKNREVDGGDLYGIYVNNGTTASVLPPSQGVDVAMAVMSTHEGTGGAVPTDLTGEWINGTASAVDFYNPSTGSWAPPSGSGMYLQLYEDGSFELSTVVQVTNYNCTTQITTFYHGVALFDGNQVTLEPEYTRQKYDSNCFSHLNSDKVVPNSPIPFKWRLEIGADGKQELVLIWLPDESESFFSRP